MRSTLSWPACLLALPLQLGALAVLATPGPPALDVAEIAPGVYLRQGVQEEVSAKNGGHIANIGFIVGRERVAVLDTGASLQEGLALRAAIRRVTDLPIAYVILTHVHPDHILGAAAFEQDSPEVIGHRMLPDAMARRGVGYIGRTASDLGAAAEGSRLVAPSTTVADRRWIDLGERGLVLEAQPTAHTNADLTILDARTGTLWLSDLLFVDRIPALDGSILGWLRACDALLQRDVARVVPGHGPVPEDWREAVNVQRRYLLVVAEGVRQVIQEQGTIGRAVEQVGRGEAAHWLLFDDYHGRNVTAAFVELEWE